MMYKLSPFSISEYLGIKNSIGDEIFAKGAPNTKPMSAREMRQPTQEVSKNPDDAQIRKSTLVFQPRESKVGKKKRCIY